MIMTKKETDKNVSAPIMLVISGKVPTFIDGQWE